MTLANHYHDVVSGRSPGPLAFVERSALRVAEVFYGLGVGYRNRAFDKKRRPTVKLDVPVISVGNITVGGTGKTPTVIWLCQELLQRLRKPVVLSRGYKAKPGLPNDESRVIAAHLPDVKCISRPDRAAAGREAIEKHNADVLVLDDGFQHRRLCRDLDVVLIDATCPFGYGHLLPRGLLRESVYSLRRADLIIITRSNQVEPGAAHQLLRHLEEQLPQRPVVRSVHRPTGFVDLTCRPAEGVKTRAKRALLFAAIANPQAFERSAKQVGVHPVAHHWWPDHHHYTPKDVEILARTMARHQATLLLTTEKDAVKLRELNVDWPGKIAALRVEIQLTDRDQQVVHDLLDNTLASRSRTGR